MPVPGSFNVEGVLNKVCITFTTRIPVPLLDGPEVHQSAQRLLQLRGNIFFCISTLCNITTTKYLTDISPRRIQHLLVKEYVVMRFSRRD